MTGLFKSIAIGAISLFLLINQLAIKRQWIGSIDRRQLISLLKEY